MNTRIDAVFVGAIARLANDSRSSAIVKSPVAGPCHLGMEGLSGDAHADPDVHGGAEKALHLYPAEHYARLAAAFPDAQNLMPGGLGENISTRGMVEDAVCLGDRYAIGNALVEVSQPRAPCWKIDHRTGVEGVASYVALHGLTGWYFRVITAGDIAAGDALHLVHRPEGAVTLADYWRLKNEARPSPERLARIIAAPGLAPDKRRKLEERADWLRRNPLPNPPS